MGLAVFCLRRLVNLMVNFASLVKFSLLLYCQSLEQSPVQLRELSLTMYFGSLVHFVT